MRILATLTLLATLLTTLLLPVSAESTTGEASTQPKPIFRLNYSDLANDTATHKQWGNGITGATGVDGTTNAAMHFDGATYIVDNALSTEKGGKAKYDALTISMWIKPENAFNGNDNNARGGLFYSNAWSAGDGVLQLYLTNGKVHPCVKGNAMNREFDVGYSVTSEWLLVTLTYDSAAKVAKLYYDGVLVKTHTFTITAHSLFFGTEMKIGADWDGKGFFKGDMEDLCIYDSALTNSEVSALYYEKAQSESGATVVFSDADLTEAKTGTHTTVSGINGGTALQFDGNTYYTSSKLNAKSYDQLTFAAWVKPDGTYADNPNEKRGVLFNSTSWVDGCMQLYFGWNALNFATKMGGTNNPYPNYNYNGAWTHIAATYNKTTGVMAYFCNGQFVTACVAASPMAVVFDNLSIGRSVADADLGFYKGLLQDVKIYNGVLTASEISALAAFDGAINKVSVTVTNDYLLNFFVDNAFDLGTTPTVTVTRDGKTVTPVISTDAGGRTKYSVAVLPQLFGDAVTVTASGKVGGKDQTFSKSYSIAQYCTDTLADKAASAELKALVTSILHYGAEAQKVVGYKTDALVNAALGAPAYATPTATVATAKNEVAGGMTFTEVDLRLESKVVVKIYYNGEAGEGLTVTVGGRNADFSVENGCILIKGIVPTEYASAIVIQDGTSGSSLTYSVNSYLVALNVSTLAAANKTLGQALYAVGVSAQAYVSSLG